METYQARKIMKDGKEVLVIEAKTEEIINEDGSKSVVIKVPALKLFNKVGGK